MTESQSRSVLDRSLAELGPDAAELGNARIIAGSLKPSSDDALAGKLRNRAAGLVGHVPLHPSVPGIAR